MARICGKIGMGRPCSICCIDAAKVGFERVALDSSTVRSTGVVASLLDISACTSPLQRNSITCRIAGSFALAVFALIEYPLAEIIGCAQRPVWELNGRGATLLPFGT